MFTRFPRREIRLVRPGPWRRVHPALAMLVAGLALSAGCSPVLARLPKEASSTVASTAVAGAPTVVPRAAPAVNTNAQPLVVLPTPDWPVPDGHFYTQTNGQPPLASPTGYSVTNRDGIPFWDEFQRLGGPAVVGYPISPRFSFQGSISQVFQRAVLQWNAQARQVHLMNVLQAIDEAGKGDWLVQTYRVPARLPASFDRGKNWDETAGDRLALLRADHLLDCQHRVTHDFFGGGAGGQRFVAANGVKQCAVGCQVQGSGRRQPEGVGESGPERLPDAGVQLPEERIVRRLHHGRLELEVQINGRLGTGGFPPLQAILDHGDFFGGRADRGKSRRRRFNSQTDLA